jgi:hypothetical protein
MRKLLLGALLLLSVVTFVSCNDGLKKSENGKLYYFTVKGKNGDETEREVKFSIFPNVVDSLKISEEKIKLICEQTVRYADWNVKHKPTYKLPEDAMLSYDAEDNTLRSSISGTAENSYGTPDNIYSVVHFTLDGKMKSDKDGMPIIESF